MNQLFIFFVALFHNHSLEGADTLSASDSILITKLRLLLNHLFAIIAILRCEFLIGGYIVRLKLQLRSEAKR